MAKIRVAQEEHVKGLSARSSDMSVGAYLERWLETDARQRCRPRTWENHARAVRRHLLPRIGGVKLAALRPLEIQDMLFRMDGDGVTASVRIQVRLTLHAALRRAALLGLIPSNPCSLVEAPRMPRRSMTVWTAAEVARFLEAARQDRLYAMYVIAAAGGMRQGEVFGMRWEDVDWKNRSVTIQRALDRSGNLVEPKTSHSCRKVDLPDFAMEVLRDHRKRMLAEGHVALLVFCDTHGNPLRQNNVLRRSFLLAIERAGVPRIRFHDVRHTHASLMLAAGENPKVVAERLGAIRGRASRSGSTRTCCRVFTGRRRIASGSCWRPVPMRVGASERRATSFLPRVLILGQLET